MTLINDLWPSIKNHLRKQLLKKIKQQTPDARSSKDLIDLKNAQMDPYLLPHAHLYVMYESVVTECTRIRLTKAQLNTAIPKFHESSLLQDALNELLDYLSYSERAGSDPLMPVAIYNPTQRGPDITTWVEMNFGLIDHRIISCDHRRLRRLDSLARLLSMRAEHSVCTAATITAISDQLRLVISSNVSAEGGQPDILRLISEKLNLIRTVATSLNASIQQSIESHVGESSIDRLSPDLATLTPSFTDRGLDTITSPSMAIDDATPPSLAEHRGSIHTMAIKQAAAGLAERLYSSGALFGRDVLEQAAYKFLDAMVLDEETFSPEAKALFTSREAPATLLLPVKRVDGKGFDLVIHSIGRVLETIHLPFADEKTLIKIFHAEQLIGFWFVNNLKLPTTTVIEIGISKLSCSTCFSFFKAVKHTYPHLSIRGTHQQHYPGVLDFNAGRCTTPPQESGARPAVTFIPPSPGDSPETAHRRTPIGRISQPLAQDSLMLEPSPAASSVPGRKLCFVIAADN